MVRVSGLGALHTIFPSLPLLPVPRHLHHPPAHIVTPPYPANARSWGAPFLEHTFTYHLSRLDHRHNFSPYFLPIYLNLTSDPGSTPASLPLSLVLKVLRHPLASFLPQFSLVLGAGFALEGVLGVEGAMFFQTAIFVVFNKVCTSQVSKRRWKLGSSAEDRGARLATNAVPPILPHSHYTPYPFHRLASLADISTSSGPSRSSPSSACRA
jgi:hypothetical protein